MIDNIPPAFIRGYGRRLTPPILPPKPRRDLGDLLIGR
jgi:hypothetical protein